MKDLRVVLEYDQSDLRRLDNFKKSGNDIVFCPKKLRRAWLDGDVRGLGNLHSKNFLGAGESVWCS